MSAISFQSSMKRLTNFRSIVKTMNTSLAVSHSVPLPLPMKNSKPLLQMACGASSVVAHREKKEEVKRFLNRPMLNYHMPVSRVKPADSLSGPLSNSKSHGQVTKNHPILMSRHSPTKDSIDKKPTKRSRSKDDGCVVDSHLSKKKRRCLSDQQNGEISKLGDVQKACKGAESDELKTVDIISKKMPCSDSDVVQKAIKGPESDEGKAEDTIPPITDHDSYNQAVNTVNMLTSFERIILKSATTDPLQLELKRKQLRTKIHTMQDMIAAYTNSQTAAFEIDKGSIDSILDCGLPPIYTKESYEEADRIVTMLKRNQDIIVNLRCRNTHPPELPLQEKIERRLLQSRVEAIEAGMKSFINGTYKKRIAARIALEKDIVKTTEFNDNECIDQLLSLYNGRLFDVNCVPTHFPKPLEWLGLSLKA